MGALKRKGLQASASRETRRIVKASVDVEVTTYLDMLTGSTMGNVDRVLLLGEGDFSFSKVLVEHHRSNFPSSPTRFHPTTKESRSMVEDRYDGAKANLKTLEDNGCSVKFDVDATEDLCAWETRGFDRIVFNFPCTQSATTSETEEADRMLIQRLLPCMKDALSAKGQIWLTLCNAQCKKWGLSEAADKNGLDIVNNLTFPLEELRLRKYNRVCGKGKGSDFKTKANITYVLTRGLQD